VIYALVIVGLLGLLTVLMMKQASAKVWTISYTLFALVVWDASRAGFFLTSLLVLGFLLCFISMAKPVRRVLLSSYLFKKASARIPHMSSTEREALEAGTVTWEGDLFSGRPDFDTLLAAPLTTLTAEEQAFLAGPVRELCAMVNDWEITHELSDLPADVWAFIKEQGFFGMIIPKRYGGLEFSAMAQMSVLVTLYGRSISLATTVSVPNSLGPAELLLKYGTEEQKNYYLPRLAKGIDIPCFALTSPQAGSDAASLPDEGIVCRRTVDGKPVIGILLNWNKRYITLCPVATVIGLAFRLFDPDNFLGEEHDLGISCALIPANTPGVIKGRRHFPMNTAFLNGPTQGKDVFVPLDALIGGPAMAGHGWRMLMECLSAGRAIGLPSSACGAAQAAAFASGAYARIRRQFNQPIAAFEGIEEPLARMAGHAYVIDAALTMTAAAIDQGAKPAVAGAILKYHSTERARKVAMDSMDIHGGKGLCLGPNNYLGRGYQESPISITVEGANILSRSLIIFGQGAIRCHPYAFLEMESIRNKDLQAFDQAFWGHFGFILSNFSRSLLFVFTDGRGLKVPKSKVARYYQWLYRYSTNLAFVADFCMLSLGAKLKRKEKLSARLGDILSHLYLVSAVLKRFHSEGELDSDLPLVDWACQDLFYECELALRGVIANFPTAWGRVILRFILQPFGGTRKPASDQLGQKLARILSTPNEVRDRLGRFVYKEAVANCPLGRLEESFQIICALADVEKKLALAVKACQVSARTVVLQIEEARAKGLLSDDEASRLQEAELARQRVIAVDDFNHSDLARAHASAVLKKQKEAV
jgi:acyl-CoA dehydrogenase